MTVPPDPHHQQKQNNNDNNNNNPGNKRERVILTLAVSEILVDRHISEPQVGHNIMVGVVFETKLFYLW